MIESYLEAIARELSWLGRQHEVDTVFFGGGTPTHLPTDQLQRLLASVREWFVPSSTCEVSMEANPIDVTPQKVRALQEGGVTRVSLGAQSFHARKLELLERDHSATQIRRALDLSREHFDSVSLDLIFATPGETVDQWHDDLGTALELWPDHISTYGLTFEQGTSFGSRLAKHELAETDDETWRSMYETAIDQLSQAGFDHYEVSNFARCGHRCRHNEVYWTGQGYFAAGPGAARFVEGRRESNHRSTTTYLRRVLDGQSPVAESEQLSAEELARDRLVFGLRRLEGICRAEFEDATGFRLDELAGAPLREFVALGLLEEVDSQIRLTRRGLMVSDSIWPSFLT